MRDTLYVTIIYPQDTILFFFSKRFAVSFYLYFIVGILFVYFVFKLNYNPIAAAKTTSFRRPNCIAETKYKK